MGLLQEKLAKYDLPQKFMAQGVYPNKPRLPH